MTMIKTEGLYSVYAYRNGKYISRFDFYSLKLQLFITLSKNIKIKK